MYGGPRVPNAGPPRGEQRVRANAPRRTDSEGPDSTRRLRDEFNAMLSDTTLHFKECIDEERLVRTREASELTQSLRRSLEEGLIAEGQVRERVLEALQRDMEALRQELQQGLRSVATVSEDVEALRHDLLAVTLSFASAKPQWQRDLEAMRQEMLQVHTSRETRAGEQRAKEEPGKAAATESKVDIVEALLAQHVQMLNKVQMVQQVQQMQLSQQESSQLSPQHGPLLQGEFLTPPRQFPIARTPPDGRSTSHSIAGADARGAGVSGGLHLEEEDRPTAGQSRHSPSVEPPLRQIGQDGSSTTVRVEENTDGGPLPRRSSKGVATGFWGTCVNGPGGALV